MKIQFVTFDKYFLSKSWKWLNEPELKKLTLTPSLTKQEQKKWFNSLGTKNDYVIWGIEANNIAIGACGLKNITKHDAEYWGYIGEKKYWGLGIGNKIVTYVVNYAISVNINLVYLKVSEVNVRAVELYLKHGFKVISQENGVLVMQMVTDKV